MTDDAVSNRSLFPPRMLGVGWTLTLAQVRAPGAVPRRDVAPPAWM